MGFTPLAQSTPTPVLKADEQRPRGFRPLETTLPEQRPRGFRPLGESPQADPGPQIDQSSAPDTSLSQPGLTEPDRPVINLDQGPTQRFERLIPPGMTAEDLSPAGVSGETPALPESILPDFLQALMPTNNEPLLKFLTPKPAPNRFPEQVIADFARGDNQLSNEEFRRVLVWLERGNFEDPEAVVKQLGLSLTPQGGEALQESAQVGQILKEIQDQPDIIPGGEGFRTFTDAFVRGATLNTLDPNLSGLPPAMARVSGRAFDIERNRRRDDNFLADLGGELTGSIMPFSMGVKFLRAGRILLGKTAVAPGVGGIVTEGATVGGPMEFIRRPEGADQMTAAEELQARYLQAGLGLGFGAVGDVAFTTASNFMRTFWRSMADKRFKQKITKEADNAGFDSPEEYVASLYDFVETPDGVVIRPTELDTGLDGTLNTKPDTESMPTPESAQPDLDKAVPVTEKEVGQTASRPEPQPARTMEVKIGAAAKDNAPELIQTSLNGSQLNISFDDARRIPSAKELEAYLKENGIDATVTRFQKNVITNTTQSTDYRIDVFKENKLSKSEAEKASQLLGGVFSNPSKFQKEVIRPVLDERKRNAQAINTLAEFERLASETTDPTVRTTLTRQAEILRTEAEGKKPKLSPKERFERGRRLDSTRDDLITAIRKLGGIDTDIESDWDGRLSHLPRKGFGLPAIERPGRGRTLDDLAETLFEEGYLASRDMDELVEKLGRAESGDDVFSFSAELEANAPREGDLPPSTDRDWEWVDSDTARTSDRDYIISDDGTVVPTRDLTLEDIINLDEEIANAERFFRKESEGPGPQGPEPSANARGDGDTSLSPGVRNKVEGQGVQSRPDQEPELPGVEPRNKARQGLSDRQRQVDDQLQGREEVAPGEGDGDLFSGKSRQKDIDDFLAKDGDGFKLREPSPDEKIPADINATSTTGRGAETVPESSGQLDLFLEPGAKQAEHVAALKTFGPRVQHVKTGSFPTGTTKVNAPSEVAHLVAPLRKEAQESLLTVITDAQGNVLRIARVHKGDISSASANPGLISGIAANTKGARNAWFVHNHPSGKPTQSGADRRLTEALHEALQGSGIEPQGMVVVAPGGKFTHFSPGEKPGAPAPVPEGGFRIETKSTGNAEAAIPAAARTIQTPITERKLVAVTNTKPFIKDPKSMAAAFRQSIPNEPGILLLNTRHQPVGWLPMTMAEMKKMRQGVNAPSQRLLAAFDETNASVFAARVIGDAQDEIAVAGNLDGFKRATGLRLLDVIDSQYRSFSEKGGIPEQSTFYANPFSVAVRETMRDIGLHPGRNIAAGFAGSVGGATVSEAEPGTAQWWLDVAAGATAGMTLSQFVRRTNLLGKGSIVDNARFRLGDYIENLPLIGRGPIELRDLKKKQRVMRQLLDRQTEGIGKHLIENFSPAERVMMADLIETRGIIKDLNLIHRQAQVLDDHIVASAQRMKDLGMLPKDMEEGGYLHRYYAKHLGLDKTFKIARGQTLAGSYSIARGTDDQFGREYFSPTSAGILKEFETLSADIAKLERIRPGLLDEDNAIRLKELKAQRKKLEENELVEYTGIQQGKLQSFLFTRDEVGRIDSGVKPTLVNRPKPKPGEIDTRTVPEIRGVSDLTPTDRVWTLRGAKKDKALLHRDWTKAERTSWGEIEDAGYRYVRGMAEVSHDMSLATLFNTIAKNTDWVSSAQRTTRKGRPWTFVPNTKVNKASPLKKYGELSGKYVRPDIWNGMRGYGRAAFAPGPAGQLYRGLLNKWKLYKTVYNPVTHLNNTYSNVEMIYQAGFRGRELSAGIRHMRQGEDSRLWREARDNGLFGTDWSSSLIKPNEGGGNQVLDDLAEQLRKQPEIPDANLTASAMMDLKEWWINSRNSITSADGKWKTGVEIARAMSRPAIKGAGFLNRPVKAATRAMQRAYKFEDEVFKMAVYQAERKAGKSSEEAIKTAQGLFFDYSDLPLGMKMVRDLPIGSPFISYTYFAIPAIARNAAQHPERMLALIAGYEALNYAALTNEGMSPGEYWQIESAESATSPPWDRGRALWGARNTVRLPYLDGYRLALGRAHALGNPFMSDAGGRQKIPNVPVLTKFWGSSIFGSNPLHALLDISINEDWKGKQVFKPGAPVEEKVQKITAYLYQAWAPSNILVPGGYHQSKVLEGMANQVRKDREAGRPEGLIAPVVAFANQTSEALGFGQFTGTNRVDNEIQTRDALLSSFGIKLRPIRTEQSVDFESSRLNREQKKHVDWFRSKTREFSEGRITEVQYNKFEVQFDQLMIEAEQKQDKLFDAEKFLKKRGLIPPPPK